MQEEPKGPTQAGQASGSLVAVQRKRGREHTDEFRALNLGGSREKAAISWLPVSCRVCWKIIVILSLII